VGFKKSEACFIEAIGEKGNAEEGLLSRVFDRVVEEFVTKPAMTMVAMDDDIFEENDESALCSTDRKKQVYHPEYQPVMPQHKYATPIRLFQNQPQPPHLFCPVRREVRLVRKKVQQQVRQLGQILQRRLLDVRLFVH
jgi:hypothetical protein